MADLFWLPDEPWAVMAPFMPKDQPGPERKDDRQIISGILHVLTSGCRWHDCPAAYGPRTTVYNRFNRWSRRGFWTAMLVLLAKAGWSGEAAAIDSTYVRAHRFLHHSWRLKPPHRRNGSVAGLLPTPRRSCRRTDEGRSKEATRAFRPTDLGRERTRVAAAMSAAAARRHGLGRVRLRGGPCQELTDRDVRVRPRALPGGCGGAPACTDARTRGAGSGHRRGACCG
jgi:transposase